MKGFEWFNLKRFIFQVTTLVLLSFLVFESKHHEPFPLSWIIIGVCIAILSFYIVPDEEEEED